jgi:hypothetical protein
MKKNGDASRQPSPDDRVFDVPKTSEEMADMERILRDVPKQPGKAPVRLSKAPDNYDKGWWVYQTLVMNDPSPPIHKFKPDQEDAARMCLAMCQHGGTLYELREDGYWWRYFCD